MVIDARRRLERVRVQEPARMVVARRANRDADRTAGSVKAGGFDRAAFDDALTVADAAHQLATVIAADPSVQPTVAACGGIDAVAKQLVPIVAWAFDVPAMPDVDAVRVGVTVARTRLLLGTPRPIVLAAVHELPAILVGNSPTTHRLDEIAIEVGLRLRRQRDVPQELRAS